MTLGEVVRAALAELPAADRRVVAAIRFRVQDRPGAAELAAGCEPGQFAAYCGRAVEVHRPPEPTGAEWDEVSPPPGPVRRADGTVTLYLANLAPLTAARVRIALLHELAHVLGWEEAEIRAFGLHLDQKGTRGCTSGS
jgi:predicted Zn-dependent protease with MMP-like domain